MDSTQEESLLFSRKSSSPEEAKEVLVASLSLLMAAAESGSYGPLHDSHEVVRRLNALTDSIDECQEPFTKKIKDSDVDKQQSRLLIPKLDFENFIQPLLKDNVDLEMGLPVQTFNTAGKAYPMQFKKRSSNGAHVLMDNWNEFVEENQLKPPKVLTIWAFRAIQTGGLCFLISSGTA